MTSNDPLSARPDDRLEGENTFDRLLDGELPQSEVDALGAALLANAELRREFLTRTLVNVAIGEQLGVDRLIEPRREPRRGRRILPWVSLALSIAAAVLVGFGLDRSTSPVTPEAVAEVASVDGEVWRVAPHGDVPCQPGDKIQSGETIRTAGPAAVASLVYPDGTRVSLAGDTTVTISQPGYKLLQVARGDVSADVAPQPANHPMRVETPNAVVEVVGTRLAVSSTAGKRTDVGVSHGEVKVTDRARHDTITVRAGEAATVSPAARPKPRVQSEVPRTWNPDVLTAWKTGQLVHVPGLDGNLVAGVRAEPVWNKEWSRPFHQVVCHNAWVDGLFEIRPSTVLHAELYMERPGFVQAFIVAREAVPDPKHSAQVFLRDGVASGLPGGKWHTVHVPIQDFKPTRVWKPYNKPCAFVVFFDSQIEDLGLTVGRVWVTAD